MGLMKVVDIGLTVVFLYFAIPYIVRLMGQARYSVREYKKAHQLERKLRQISKDL